MFSLKERKKPVECGVEENNIREMIRITRLIMTHASVASVAAWSDFNQMAREHRITYTRFCNLAMDANSPHRNICCVA